MDNTFTTEELEIIKDALELYFESLQDAVDDETTTEGERDQMENDLPVVQALSAKVQAMYRARSN